MRILKRTPNTAEPIAAEARLTDDRLVKRCLGGDDSAWEEIVRLHAGRIFRLCYRYTGRREEAEDLIQEAFIRIYQNLASFRSGTGCFQNWAMKLTRNLIIDRYRRARRFQQLGGSEELEAMNLEDHSRPSPQKNLERDETSQLVRKALCALSPENKEAVILHDLQGMDYDQMAEVLGIPEGTVKSRISRGRLALARQLFRNPALKEMWA